MTEELNGGCLDEREAFEAYARRDGLNVTRRVVDDGLTYVALATETAWQFWKASRRAMPETRFASWCADLLTKAESRGLHLDADKRAILNEARASLPTSKQAGAAAVAVPCEYGTGDGQINGKNVTLLCLRPGDPIRPGEMLLYLAAPGAAIAAREQEQKRERELLDQFSDAVHNQLRANEQQIQILCNELANIARTAERGGLHAAITKRVKQTITEAAKSRASRKEAPATPQAAIPAAPSSPKQITEAEAGTALIRAMDDLGLNKSLRADIVAAYVRHIAALTQPTTVQQAPQCCPSSGHVTITRTDGSRKCMDCDWKRHALKTAQTTALPGNQEAA